MKEIRVTGVDSILEALQEGRLLYNVEDNRKYWLYNGVILSRQYDDEDGAVIINASMDSTKEYWYYG